MNTSDAVQGILEPYLNAFQLWGKTNKTFNTGDAVPAVGVATSYSVQLPSSDPESRSVFLQVKDGRITNVMALQPLPDSSVFDPFGRYLGTGGGELEPMPVTVPKPPVDVLSAIQEQQAQKKEEVRPQELEGYEERTPRTTVHDRAVETPPRSLGQLIEDIKETVDALPDPEPCLHRFRLREDFDLVLDLPDDLTEHEAKRIALFVSSLPLGDDEKRF